MADLQVSVYPNPATDKVRIEASGMNQIIVCDLAGRVIRDITTSCDDVTLDVSDLQSALYLLRIVFHLFIL